jgi:hypothetical protein
MEAEELFWEPLPSAAEYPQKILAAGNQANAWFKT